MKKTTILLTTICALGLTLGAYANGANISTPANNSLSGAYVGLGAGIGGMETDSPADAIGPAGRIYGGYLWQATPHILYGVEGGFNAYHDNDYSANIFGYGVDWTYSGYSADLLSVIKYHFDDGFNVFGKAGAAYTYESLEIMGDEQVSNVSYLPEGAVGFGYDFKNNISTNLSYSRIFKMHKSNNSVDLLMLNVEYHFA